MFQHEPELRPQIITPEMSAPVLDLDTAMQDCEEGREEGRAALRAALAEVMAARGLVVNDLVELKLAAASIEQLRLMIGKAARASTANELF